MVVRRGYEDGCELDGGVLGAIGGACVDSLASLGRLVRPRFFQSSRSIKPLHAGELETIKDNTNHYTPLHPAL